VIRILRYIFLCMFVYGVWAGLLGAALLSLGMWAFVCYAEGVFAAQDRAYAADPRNARALGPSTNDALAEHDCECMRSRF
jgi:hypothetical protein